LELQIKSSSFLLLHRFLTFPESPLAKTVKLQCTASAVSVPLVGFQWLFMLKVGQKMVHIVARLGTTVGRIVRIDTVEGGELGQAWKAWRRRTGSTARLSQALPSIFMPPAGQIFVSTFIFTENLLHSDNWTYSFRALCNLLLIWLCLADLGLCVAKDSFILTTSFPFLQLSRRLFLDINP
jgi:hypothetical protein